MTVQVAEVHRRESSTSPKEGSNLNRVLTYPSNTSSACSHPMLNNRDKKKLALRLWSEKQI